jgi:SAM-dependent methyltransferase
MTSFYWLSHKRYVENGRMRWHAGRADETFWANYWREQVTPAYYQKAAAADLAADEVGHILPAERAPRGRHLEAGCGAGYWVAALRQAGLDVEGIEYARDLVERVNAVCPELPVRYGNALHIERPDNTYASYLSFGVVEHLLGGPEPFLCEAYRVLAPGGKAFISVPFLGPMRKACARLGRYEAASPALPFFQYGFDAAEFMALLRNAGFVVDSSHPVYLHRMLLEESAAYRWLYDRRYGAIPRRLLAGLFRGRDGHMLLVVAHKPAADGQH